MAAFGDYDQDGHLDMYLVTYRKEPAPGLAVPPPTRNADGTYEIAEAHREYVDVIVDKNGIGRVIKAGQADRLYRNTGDGRFVNVSADAGIGGYHWGLSANWWDYDRDGDLDLYVSNDFYGPDHLYRNNGDGTFTDVAPEAIAHTPWYSMGTDVGDINNDGWPDLMGSDMAGTSHYKQKASMGDMSTNAWFLVHGEPRQVMQNALYLNTGTERFMEIASLAGVASTDWTWSLKFADLDEDGWVDLFVTNGMNRDWTNTDTRARADAAATADERLRIWLDSPRRDDPNLAFRNNGQLHFDDVSGEWGLGEKAVSYGAALGDLDRDGDLDLIVNNANQAATLAENRSSDGSRVLIRLEGNQHKWGIGATVRIQAGGQSQMRTLTSGQGYMSANEPLMHFGLGDAEEMDELVVEWQGGGVQRFEKLPANRYYFVTEPAVGVDEPNKSQKVQERIFAALGLLDDFLHAESPFNDYRRQPLLPHQHSQLGPGLACADVNGDGHVDLFVGGASGQAGQLLMNQGDGTFAPLADALAPWSADAECEDMGLLFFDADGDADPDLYIVSGGVECEPGDEVLRDRLYRNDGASGFTKLELPDVRDSGSVVTACDIDRDGDLDLFVGSRIVPGRYPLSSGSRLFLNDGTGRFEEAGEPMSLGMVTSALWSDVDADGWTDLLVATELGPVRLLRNMEGTLHDDTEAAGLGDRDGWWNSIASGDFDLDGDLDFVVGNLGHNTKYHPSPEKPYLLYFGAFEGAGQRNLIEAKFEGDQLYPMRGKSCSTNAMPHLGEKFPTFHNFAAASLEEIYSETRLDEAQRFEANHTDTGVFLNDGRGTFEFHALPRTGTGIADLRDHRAACQRRPVP